MKLLRRIAIPIVWLVFGIAGIICVIITAILILPAAIMSKVIFACTAALRAMTNIFDKMQRS